MCARLRARPWTWEMRISDSPASGALLRSARMREPLEAEADEPATFASLQPTRWLFSTGKASYWCDSLECVLLDSQQLEAPPRCQPPFGSPIEQVRRAVCDNAGHLMTSRPSRE